MSAFLGEHGFGIYLSAIAWALPGIAVVKAYYYDRRLNTSFKWKYWLNDNLRSVIIGLLGVLIFVRLGDAALHYAKEAGFNIASDLTDFVGISLIFSILLQNYLHKKRKPVLKSVQHEMDVQNPSNR